jgi:hypothetical protein
MTWIQTASGRAFDIINPRPEDVDFEVDIPEALARIARFTGHVRAGAYSVAQHCVIGADFMFASTHRNDYAAAFLLHDAHEAYIGDIATPVAAALIERTAREYADDGIHGRKIAAQRTKRALAAIKTGIDAAIYAAAGLSWPYDHAMHDVIKEMDLRMLATERRHLLGASARPWDAIHELTEPLPLRGKISVWPWPRAADEYRCALKKYLPQISHTSRTFYRADS